MADGRPRYHPDGGQRLDQDHGEDRRRDHRRRVSVFRRPEDRPAGARGAGRRQGTTPLRRQPLIMGSTRRTVLKTGAAATAMAAAPKLFAQQSGKAGTTMSFYQKGAV